MVLDERFYRIYTTINKLLKNRGYIPEVFYTYEELKLMDRESLVIIASSSNKKKIIVFFPEEERVGIKPIRQYKMDMLEKEIHNAIIVVKSGITPKTKASLIDGTMNIEIFNESELLIDITEHILVPKHRVLSLEEKESLLKKHSIKENQLPKILITDPISRYYGLKKKDIVEITRISETAGYYTNYRIVV